MNNPEKIAVFDSGIGGITFLREAVKALPHEEFIYYADTDNVPYGIKPREEVKKYIFNAVDFLASQKIKILVVACNSATSAAINDLRQEYSFPVLGMEPAVKPAVEKCKDKRVLVIATTLTLNEEKLKNLISNIDKDHKVDKVAMDKLVRFAEEFRFSDKEAEEYIINTLPENLNDYGTVVLGCTHFIYFRQLFRKILPDGIELIDGNSGTLNNMMNIMKKNALYANKNAIGNITFYSSGRIDNGSRVERLESLFLV